MAPGEPMGSAADATGNGIVTAVADIPIAGNAVDTRLDHDDDTAIRIDAPVTPIVDVPEAAVQSSAGRFMDRFALDLATDFVALWLSAVAGLLFLSIVSRDPANSLDRFWIGLFHLAVLFPAFLISFTTYGLYRGGSRSIQPSVFDDLKDIIHAIAAGGFLALAIVVVIHKVTAVQISVSSQLVAMGATGLVLIPTSRVFVSNVLRWRIYGATRIVVVGTGTIAKQLARRLRAVRGVTLVGFVDDNPVPGTEVMGTVSQLAEICRTNRVDQLMVAFSQAHPASLTTLLRPLHGRVSIAVVPRFFDVVSPRSHIDEIYGLPVVDVAAPRLGLASHVMKRGIDITVASIALVLFGPLLSAIAIAIKLTSPGPVLFRQTRIGYKRRAFTILKFRTMAVGSEALRDQLRHRNEADGPLFKLKEDPRATIIGRALRRSSLDELPQLWNVVRGEMSLVGPRPFVPEESSQIDGWAARRFEVRPGLTGQWQVAGRNQLAHEELCRLDYLYVACWSMQWDLRILWQTVGRVVSGYGAS